MPGILPAPFELINLICIQISAKVSFNIIPSCELIIYKSYVGYTNAELEDRAS